MLELLGVPFDLCGRRRGSALGPAAIRQAGLEETLTALGLSVTDVGDLPCAVKPISEDGIRHFHAAYALATTLKTRVSRSIESGHVPLVIGGDHSLSMGSVAGALAQNGSDLAVLWIDAHADLNTPGTSPSGNLHGMPLSVALGRPAGAVSATIDEQWSRLVGQLVPTETLKPARVGWIGLRDVDPSEKAAIEGLEGCFATTMQDVDRFGVERVVTAFDRWIRSSAATRLWISFDVDVLDPILAPGTGTAVRGGLSYREAHLVAELLHDLLFAPDCPYRLAGLDLVETNPLVDTFNSTALVAVEWIGSLFGKTILRSRRSIVI